MHPEADALLDAIFDAPDDDTPRLVFADWLQEHGQENYAQFIRLQCAAAREPLWSAEANRLWKEIGRVWARLDQEWWPATRDVWNVPVTESRWNPVTSTFLDEPGTGPGLLDAIHFHRGFLRESVPLTASALIAYGDSCWPWGPFPSVVLEPDGAESELLARPRAARIRSLRLVGWEDPPHALWFAGAPELVSLERLDLTDLCLVESDVDYLLRSELFPKLKEVRLRAVHAIQNEPVAGCLTAGVDTSSARLAQLRRRLEARFEKVVWNTDG
ncbi:MAG TPA: TIGR02996 domain-containing protein [Gemmata sp.]